MLLRKGCVVLRLFAVLLTLIRRHRRVRVGSKHSFLFDVFYQRAGFGGVD